MKNMDKNFVFNDIKKNHNRSWFKEIYIRNEKRQDKPALYYRGSKYTYGEFFKYVIEYSKALKAAGINKGDEFVACLRQTPDYPILVAAASYIGAKVNLIAPDFDKDYIAEIIDKADSTTVFVNNWDFSRMEYSLKKANKAKNIVTLNNEKWEKIPNPFKEVTDRFYAFNENEYNLSTSQFDNIMSDKEFLDAGKDYTGELDGHGKLEDEIAITYTSGSTKKGYHKAVCQRNETYIFMGRYHDPEVCGIPKMDNLISYAAIGPHADTVLLSGVSDTLIQGGAVALDPIIDENYFLYAIKFNNVGMGIGTRTYWIRAMKDACTNPEFKDLTLPYLYAPCEGGEPLAAGEEKALNKWLKKVKAGINVTHTPISVTKMTIGGGDSEHGSIFVSLFRDYFNPLQKVRGIHEPMGLDCYDFAECKCLREDGTYCNEMEMGRLVANSPTAMKGYHNNPEASKDYFIKDAYGKVWGDLACYGYIDHWKKVYIKGRIGKNDPYIKPFQISDIILRDTKNIMSCEVVNFNDNNDKLTYVAHIETQYFNKNVNIEKTLKSAANRVYNEYGQEIANSLYFRIRGHVEGYPTLFTAKRNLIALKEEGVSDICIKCSDLLDNNDLNKTDNFEGKKLVRQF